MRSVCAILLTAIVLTACASGPRGSSLVEERSIEALQADLAAGRTSSEALVRAYLARIEAIDRSGPTLRSVISVNPQALAQARALDAERRAGRVRGPLHGIPILIKDNIETRELPTTAGSLALAANAPGRDAGAAAQLREAGAILIGKANLSEWANFRSTRSISGWSAVGGLVKNPYALDRNPCGSSSGSAVAAAASLAAAAIGTETSGSIVCPASANGVVGLKPTVGLVSQVGVVPIAHSMDTPGPMTRSVRDAAIVLDALAETGPASVLRPRGSFAAGLRADALKGRRLGVLRLNSNLSPKAEALFEAAVADLVAAGAEVVEIRQLPNQAQVGAATGTILQTEFKADIAAYLAAAAPAVRARTLAELIAFNAANAEQELALFGQELFEQSEATRGLDDPVYRAALESGKRLAGPEGIDRLLAEHRLDALVAITGAPAWLSDTSGASRPAGFNVAIGLPAVAGYPHLTVPMGLADGLPVGLSFIGTAWSEGLLLSLGYAYEQATRRRVPPTYPTSINETPAIARTLAPANLEEN